MEAFQGPTMQFFFIAEIKVKNVTSREQRAFFADIQTFSAKEGSKLHDKNSNLKLPVFSN